MGDQGLEKIYVEQPSDLLTIEPDLLRGLFEAATERHSTRIENACIKSLS